MKGTATAQIRLPGDVLLYTKGLIIAENWWKLYNHADDAAKKLSRSRDPCAIRSLHDPELTPSFCKLRREFR